MFNSLQKLKGKLEMPEKKNKAVFGFDNWEILDEDGRQVIYEWSEKRRVKLSSKRNSYYRRFLVYTFTINTLKSFFENFNFMVLVQMAFAAAAVYISKSVDLSFDVHVSLFVSPIVFPLAFSINTDFQRREKVLEDLASFKSSAMTWFFCMRDWREAAELDTIWMKAVHQKLKSMLFYMREYLLTEKIDRRKVILRAMYEDFSDTNQLIENVRASALPTNTAIVSRVVHLLNMMCLSFERLRVVREYRSPRSIRSFNKVLIFLLPVILSPYFVFMGKKTENEWSPYYVAVLVAFVFSALQGVQDKLDDPFDGMSEDDINLSTIDEWTFHSLEATVNRTFTIGRFKVLATQANVIDPTETIHQKPENMSPTSIEHLDGPHRHPSKRKGSTPIERSASKKRDIDRTNVTRSSTIRKIFRKQSDPKEMTSEPFHPESHPYANVLDKIKGSTTILRGGHVKQKSDSMENLPGSSSNGLANFFALEKEVKIDLDHTSNGLKSVRDKTVSFSNLPPTTSDDSDNSTFNISFSGSASDSQLPLLNVANTSEINGRFKLNNLGVKNSAIVSPVIMERNTSEELGGFDDDVSTDNSSTACISDDKTKPPIDEKNSLNGSVFEEVSL